MIDRIKKNEERFDRILVCTNELQGALDKFNMIKKDLNLLKKYYYSKNWIMDKESYENGLIDKIKAGVLSEDGVWNMLSDIDEIMIDMKGIIDNYEHSK